MKDLKKMLEQTNGQYNKIDRILKSSTYDDYEDLSGLDIDYRDGKQLFLLEELQATMWNLDEVRGRPATMNMFDKQSLIQRLKELSFPEKEYRVVAGGAMVLHGFRPQTCDIDLGCSTLLADRLEQQGYFVSRCDDGTRRILYSENIEIFENWLEGTVEIISGVPVVCVDGLIQMKKKLGREKDLADIALMKK